VPVKAQATVFERFEQLQTEEFTQSGKNSSGTKRSWDVQNEPSGDKYTKTVISLVVSKRRAGGWSRLMTRSFG